MSDADVLSYLFVGRPADQLAGSGEGGGLESAAAALAAGVAARELVALLPGAVPIDTLDLRISESGAPSEVQIGKYLTDRVFVRYGRVLGPEPEDQVRVELRLDEHWSLESDLSSNESAGADVIWSLDY
jgi:autotransporter translocation and assembly factor TamB